MSDLIKTSISPDKKTKILFWGNPNGQFRYSVEHLRAGDGPPQSYSIWPRDHPESGLYPDLESATRDAQLRYGWLARA